MWGDDPPARVEASLQSHVARLRRALEPDRAVRRAGAAATDPRRRLLPGGACGRRGRPSLRGPGAGGTRPPRDRPGGGGGTADRRARTLAGDGVRRHRRALAGRRGDPARRAPAGGGRGPLGRPGASTVARARRSAELEQLVRTHPLRERLWALLATALYRSHRQGDALAALRRAREHLADELGVDPGPELRRLEDLVLRQDPSLDAPAAAAPRADGAPAPAPPAAAEPRYRRPCRSSGRETLLDLATTTLREAAAGRGRVIVLSGEPGIGKTRFAEALAGRAESLGFRVGRGGWEAEASPPLWGWRSALDRALGGRRTSSTRADRATSSTRRPPASGRATRSPRPSAAARRRCSSSTTCTGPTPRAFGCCAAARPSSETLPLVVVVATRSAEAEIGPALADALAALARARPPAPGAHRPGS